MKALSVLFVGIGLWLLIMGYVAYASADSAKSLSLFLPDYLFRYMLPGWSLVIMGWAGLAASHAPTAGDQPRDEQSHRASRVDRDTTPATDSE